MSFVHGLKAKTYVNGVDLTPFFKSFSIEPTVELADVSVLGRRTTDNIPGMEDATFSAEGFFDGDPNAVNAILRKALGALSAPSVWSYLPEGDIVGKLAINTLANLSGYPRASATDDATTVTVDGQSKVGEEQGVILHGFTAETATGTGATFDFGAAAVPPTHGPSGAAYAHVGVLGPDGGTLDLQVHHSSDNFAVDDTIAAQFAIVSGTGDRAAQRIEIPNSLTLKRYARLEWAFGGGLTSAIFFAALNRAPQS
jgi:hypothetical protein